MCWELAWAVRYGRSDGELVEFFKQLDRWKKCEHSNLLTGLKLKSALVLNVSISLADYFKALKYFKEDANILSGLSVTTARG